MSENTYGKLNGVPLVPESSEWELVLWDSIATPGDYEHTGSGEEWVASSVQIGKPIKRSFDASVTIAIRRRRTQPTQWISVRERLPIEIDYPMWVFCGDVVADSLTHYADSVERPEVHGWSTARELAITHFCPKPKQEPPPLPALPPPTSASEKAFEGWHDSTKAVLKCSKDEARAIWFAGFSTKDKI